jgi:hypothetical protein
LLGEQQIEVIAGWRLIQSQPVQGIFPDFHLDGGRGDASMRAGRNFSAARASAGMSHLHHGPTVSSIAPHAGAWFRLGWLGGR